MRQRKQPHRPNKKRHINQGQFATKTNLAVISMEYCCCLLSERDVWMGLGGGGRHGAMIPLCQREYKIMNSPIVEVHNQ
jgi:hypothetical protein